MFAASSLVVVSLVQPGPSAIAGQAAAPAPAASTETRYLETPPGKKPRIVITADPELDDHNSMIRYVLMSDGYQTEGLNCAPRSSGGMSSSTARWTRTPTART
jgi:hypothetical protein